MIGIIGGHGGKDRGTTAGGIDEADYCLAFTRDLTTRARAMWPDLPVTLLRASDESLSLRAAAKRAQDAFCGLAMVVHVNAHATAPLSGGSCYYWPGDHLARDVGDAILGAYPSALRPLRLQSWPATDKPTTDDDWLQRPRAVLEPYHRLDTHAVLVELAYASHPRDYEAMHRRWLREALLLACMAGIAEWMELTAPEAIPLVGTKPPGQSP